MNDIKSELEYELTATRKLLERVPEDKLDWKPHHKSMTLGQLALHVAQIPGRYAKFAENGTVTLTELVNHPQAGTKKEILSEFDQKTASAKSFLDAVKLEKMNANWTLTDQKKTLLEVPVSAFCRLLMLNHWFHHRGQLTVYLRLLDIAVPSVYGPSADENPFG